MIPLPYNRHKSTISKKAQLAARAVVSETYFKIVPSRYIIYSRGWHGTSTLLNVLARSASYLLASVSHDSRLYSRDDQMTNTTRVGITGNGDGSHDYRLTGLKKYTQYSIIVKAFNSKGDGPGSDPVMTHTLEDGKWKNLSATLLYLPCSPLC